MKIRVVGFTPGKNEIMYSGYGEKEFGIAQEVNGKPKEPDGSVV